MDWYYWMCYWRNEQNIQRWKFLYFPRKNCYTPWKSGYDAVSLEGEWSVAYILFRDVTGYNNGEKSRIFSAENPYIFHGKTFTLLGSRDKMQCLLKESDQYHTFCWEMLPDIIMEKKSEYSALEIPTFSTEKLLHSLEVGVWCSVSWRRVIGSIHFAQRNEISQTLPVINYTGLILIWNWITRIPFSIEFRYDTQRPPNHHHY